MSPVKKSFRYRYQTFLQYCKNFTKITRDVLRFLWKTQLLKLCTTYIIIDNFSLPICDYTQYDTSKPIIFRVLFAKLYYSLLSLLLSTISTFYTQILFQNLPITTQRTTQPQYTEKLRTQPPNRNKTHPLPKRRYMHRRNAVDTLNNSQIRDSLSRFFPKSQIDPNKYPYLECLLNRLSPSPGHSSSESNRGISPLSRSRFGKFERGSMARPISGLGHDPSLCETSEFFSTAPLCGLAIMRLQGCEKSTLKGAVKSEGDGEAILPRWGFEFVSSSVREFWIVLS